MSTQKYIDGEKGWIDSVLSGTPIVEGEKVSIEPVIDIDPDIEKEISLIQESKLSEKIKEINLVEEKQPVELTNELGSFFTAITKEKADLTEKIKKEEVKIEGLENLFNELSVAKKKKKVLLVEPEKKKKVLLVEPEKSEWDKKQQEIDEELERVAKQIEEREELAKPIEAESINEYKAPDDMIDRVKKQISDMKNANELDKERINQLSSLDSWEKLKEEFLNFKHTVNVQLGTVGGGGLDPHNIYSDFLPGKTNYYDLGSADRTWKDLHLSGAITVNGVVTGTGFTIGSAVITEAELEILDGATVTTTELNLIDGGTSRGTDALASGDGILINDAGTMKMTNVDTVKTFMQTGLSSEGTGILSTGEGGGTKFLREDGDGTSSWQTVSANVPSSADGQALGSASLEWSDLFLADGGTVTFGNDQDITLTHNADTGLTLNGVMAATALDISGNADIDGTLEADAYTVDGTALNEYIADTVGAMVTSNTESGITVAYQDGDNTLDFTIGTLNQNTTGTAAVATVATTVTITDNESTNENNAVIFTAGGDVDGGNLGLESDGNLTYNPSSGTLNVPNISVSGTQTIVDSVTMNASNAVVFEGATADAYETTLTTVDATADRTINLPNASDTLVGKATTDTLTNKTLASPVFTTQFSIGSAVISEAELETIDGVTAGTVAASKAVVVDANKDISGFRHMTIGGNLLPSQNNTYNIGSSSLRFNDLFLAGDTINLAGSTISADGTGTISISADGVTLPTGSKVGNNEVAVFGAAGGGTTAQVVRKVDFFSAAGGLSTANATFEFNAEVADRYSFTDGSTFTLADGSSLSDPGVTLFQF